MARYNSSSCRLCRREGLKLQLKGERCETEKCAFERRSYAPGQHGNSRKKHSDYGVQLREKQKVKRLYGVLEKGFRRYFAEAASKKGVTGWLLLLSLEQRLDNMIYRMGFAVSRNNARQLVRHNHFLINGKSVNIPSYKLNVNDVVTVKEKSQNVASILYALDLADKRGVPRWLNLEKDKFSCEVTTLPERDDLTIPINEQLIVELYSK
ncbi:MAG: 30S ribosomal protein S4 [Pseudomonadota bacterium]